LPRVINKGNGYLLIGTTGSKNGRQITRAIEEGVQDAGDGAKNELVFKTKSLERPLRHGQEVIR